MTDEEVRNLRAGDLVLRVSDDDWDELFQMITEDTAVLIDCPEEKNCGIEFTTYLFDLPWYRKVEFELGQVIEDKCECGAEKCGYTTHSHWCPKHE